MSQSKLNRERKNGHLVNRIKTVEQKGTVLLATSDPKTSSLMQQLLTKNGYSTVVVDSCKTALYYLLEYSFDIVIMDTGLKELDGLDVLNLEKQRRRTRKETMVVITDDHSYETGERIAEMGVFFTVDKPIEKNFAEQLIESFEARLNQVSV